MERVKDVVVKTLSKASIFAGVAGAVLFNAANPVYAQDYVPDWIEKIISGLGLGTGQEGPVAWAKVRVQWGLTILFVVVFIVAIIYSAMAGIKFMSSQGDASKLEESKAAVKAILMGFAAMIIAIVGIFVVLWLFGAGGEFNNALNVNNKPSGT
ncbi:hypothetical protein JW766_01155 [Candidatus Dojkabacteria bacterium]|nr:hypothetical protein [Candidatus Dojkabacteria bacterium]